MSSRVISTFVAVVAYEVVVALWLYVGVRHSAAGAWDVPLQLAVITAGVALGFFLGTWWALAAGALLPVLALPGGDYRGDESPLWLVMFLYVPVLAFWIAVGVGLQRLARRRAS
jgi:hypothetical protein